MAERLALRSPVQVTRPTAYHFVFAGSGWAIFTLNDETCEFGIQSDWGVYGYRWHQSGLGKRTLTEFVAAGSYDYLVNKLQLGTQTTNLKDVLDEDRTLSRLREEICRARREGGCDRERARELWDEVDEWRSTDFETACCPEELSGFLGGQPWEYLHFGPSGWSIVLRDVLLPFFCSWLRENVLTKQAEVSNVP